MPIKLLEMDEKILIGREKEDDYVGQEVMESRDSERKNSMNLTLPFG